MPKLWTETIDAHRAAVRDAALDATAELVAERGLVSLTMSQIAERAGIGRATLYKYFPHVHAVLAAWHERQITAHLDRLAAIAESADPAVVRLEAALRAYARTQRHTSEHHGGELAALLHRGEHVDEAHRRLRGFLEGLIGEAVRAGDLRDDVPADELAGYCLYALLGAGALRDQHAVDRLVTVTITGLRPEGQ